MMYTSSTSGSAPIAHQGAQTFKKHHLSSLGDTMYNHSYIDCQVPEPENYRQAFSEWVDRAAKYLSTCLRHKDYNIDPNIVPNQNGLRELAHLAARAHKENLDFLDLVAASKHATECFELLSKDYPFTGKKEYLENLTKISKLYVDYYSSGKVAYKSNILRQIDKLKDEIQKQIQQPKESDLAKKAKEILQSTSAPECQLDYSLFPSEIREYIEYKSTFSKAPSIFILSSLLVSLSAIFKNSFYMPKGAYFSDLWANIWICNIAASGSFKSSAMELGNEIAMQIQREVEEKIKPLKQQLKELAQDREVDKEILAQIREEIYKQERKMTLLPNRNTPEAMISRLARQEGGAFFLDELAAWIEAKSKNYLKDFKGLLVEMYDNRRIDEETRTYGRIICERPYVSICGVSTLRWLESVITSDDVESGFLARFLIFYPHQERIVPGALPEYQDYDFTVNNRIRDIINYVHEKTETESEPKKMYVSPSAKKFFEKFHGELYKLFDLFPEEHHHLLEPFIKRWSPSTLKLAMLFQPFIDPDVNLISLEAIVAAAELVEHAVKSTLHLLQSTLGESEFQRNCRRILQLIAKRGGQAQRRQIIASKLLPGGTKEYDEVLEALIESGQITLTDTGKKLDWIYSLT